MKEPTLLLLAFQSIMQLIIQQYAYLVFNPMVLEVSPLHLDGIFNTHLQLLVIYLDKIVQTHIQNPIYAAAHFRTAILPRK